MKKSSENFWRVSAQWAGYVIRPLRKSTVCDNSIVFDRYDLHNILNLKCNFYLVVLRAGCAQFMTFLAGNSTVYTKSDFKGGL